MSTETALRLSLDLDGRGRARVTTGIGFLDHLLTLLVFHAGFDLELVAAGDLDVDEHHTVEDVLAALGDALAEALGERDGIERYGAATVPMDEATRHGRRRPRAAATRRGRPRVRRRQDRRTRADAAAARARAARGAGRDHPAPDRVGRRRPPRRRGRLQGARSRARPGLRSRWRRRSLDEGARVKVVPGRLRRRQRPQRLLGTRPRRSGSRGRPTIRSELLGAPLVVVAGVGHVASAAAGLGVLADALRERAAAGRPVLGICVGMQLLFEEARRAAAASACSAARSAGCARGRCRTWAGTPLAARRPSRC